MFADEEFYRSCVGPLDVARLATGRDVVRRTGSTSVQRAWLARAPGLVYPILNIEVLSASFRQSIVSPGLNAAGITPLPFERGSGSRHSVILLPYHHGPYDARHLIGQRDGGNHSRFPAEHMPEPVVGKDALMDDPSNNAHGSDNQQPANIGLSHLADTTKAGLPTR